MTEIQRLIEAEATGNGPARQFAQMILDIQDEEKNHG